MRQRRNRIRTITDEQKLQIRSLFSGEKVNVDIEAKPDGYYVLVSSSYEYVSFNVGSVLSGYVKIAEILGCSDGDELDRFNSPGCDTCGWGSSYTIELKFW